MLSAVPLALILALSAPARPADPRGPQSPTQTFSIAVSGAAGGTVRLRALDVPPGYIASFCTRRVCALFRVSFILPRSGRESVELQLTRNVPGARRPAFVRVAADGVRTASLRRRGPA